MRTRSSRTLIALITLVVAAGCRAPAEEARTATTADTTFESAHGAAAELLPMGLALKDDGRAVELAPAQVLLVSLPANHSTGFAWALRDSVGPALVREGAAAYEVDSSSGVGAGGFETWRFRATAAGPDTIVLDYRRSGDADEPAETTVRYFVTVR